MNYTPSIEDQRLIERAATAVWHEGMTAEAKFAWGVDEVGMARVLLALDRGEDIRRLPSGRWVGTPGRLLLANLSSIVGEGIRTGLMTHVRQPGPTGYEHHLIPARVHLATPTAWLSRCEVAGEGMGPKRVRLSLNPAMVDCLACLDRL